MLKQFLEDQGIPYEERNVSYDRRYAAELASLGTLGVPTTVVDGQVIIGYQPQQALDAVGVGRYPTELRPPVAAGGRSGFSRASVDRPPPGRRCFWGDAASPAGPSPATTTFTRRPGTTTTRATGRPPMC